MRILLLTVFLFCIYCNGQEYQKDIIDLKTLDLKAINAEKFYVNSHKEDNLKISNNRQYVKISDFDNGCIEFQVVKSSNKDIVAKFDETNFSTVNAIASKGGKLMIINSEAYLKPEEVNKLYISLIRFYGDETKAISKGYGKYSNIYTYTWSTKGKVIKLVSISNPKSPESLREINEKIPDQDLKIVNERPKTILFICNKENLDDVIKLDNPHNNWPKFK
ncbi:MULTISPECIES: hypothetical protein [Elizabethkingia]|uniref:hypothetical protein n=1 Tax=Elizabethkingia TaxID=308865 RepID=UPI00201398F5|nr:MULTISPECIES: hypothetical protein [Elizabethkingia]MCL1671454.1 hypothetical protein [Elizabethkingia ursingii]MCL1680826.1 hypothetical protein [Elizabethkingia miricola]